jgi:hypothetical protein
MSGSQAPDDGEISEATMRLVARAIEDAGEIPGPDELADLLAGYRERAQVTPEQFRAATSRAIRGSQEVAYLLGQLAGLTGHPGEGR